MTGIEFLLEIQEFLELANNKYELELEEKHRSTWLENLGNYYLYFKDVQKCVEDIFKWTSKNRNLLIETLDFTPQMFEDLINLHKDYFIYEHGIIQIQRKKVDMIPLSMSDQEIREIKQFIQQSDWFTFEERSML